MRCLRLAYFICTRTRTSIFAFLTGVKNFRRISMLSLSCNHIISPFISLVHACVSNEILEKGSSVGREGGLGGGGDVLGILGGVVPPGSLNPDPISDQNMSFFIRLHALIVPLRAIPDSRP